MHVWLRYQPNLIVSSSTSFLVGFQHVCYYGKARRSGTAGIVPPVPGLEYGQNGQRRVFACLNRGNAISDQETSRWSPRREEASSWVCWSYPGRGCDRNTRGNASSKPPRQMPSLPSWQRKASAAMVESQRNRSTFIRLTRTADSWANTTSAQNATRAPCDTAGVQRSQNDHLLAGDLYSHTYFTCAEFCTHDVYSQDSQHDSDVDSDLLTDEGTSTG